MEDRHWDVSSLILVRPGGRFILPPDPTQKKFLPINTGLGETPRAFIAEVKQYSYLSLAYKAKIAHIENG